MQKKIFYLCRLFLNGEEISSLLKAEKRKSSYQLIYGKEIQVIIHLKRYWFFVLLKFWVSLVINLDLGRPAIKKYCIYLKCQLLS